MVPVHVSVTVEPAVVGTATVLAGGVEAPTGPTASRRTAAMAAVTIGAKYLNIPCPPEVFS
jgi:hypothetical protein